MIAAMLLSCLAGGGARADDEDEFEQLTETFLERYLQEHPVTATQLGHHQRDGLWPDISDAARTGRAEWLRGVRSALTEIDTSSLGAEQKVDAAILAQRLDASLFSMAELRPWETNPRAAVGTVGSGLDYLVTRDFAPLPQRMESLRERLDTLPTFLEQAQTALGTPARIHTETAFDQNRGLLDFVEGPMRAQFHQVPDQAAALETAADRAAEALNRHQTFLEEDLLPRSTSDYRIGPDLYARKLQFTLDTNLGPDEVVAKAWVLLDETTTQMAEVATQLHPDLFPGDPLPEGEPAVLIRKVLDRIADDHPDDATLLQEAQRTLREATRFVATHDFVTLPNEAVDVIEMPEFRRGVAIAYCDAPGPFEQQRQTFYAIAPPPRGWSEERRESFYREYNRAMLKELTVHEAMPGHYLQLAHASRFASAVRSVFGSGTFVEGWALYSEWMMIERGFGGPTVRMQRLKMVLRLCINAILDHGVHAGSMTHDEALALMTGKGFQEEGEAEGKWRRACLTSTQLSTYLVGMLEVLQLREDAEVLAGDSFDVKVFNDELLAHGSPAPRHLRTLLALD